MALTFCMQESRPFCMMPGGSMRERPLFISLAKGQLWTCKRTPFTPRKDNFSTAKGLLLQNRDTPTGME